MTGRAEVHKTGGARGGGWGAPRVARARPGLVGRAPVAVQERELRREGRREVWRPIGGQELAPGVGRFGRGADAAR